MVYNRNSVCFLTFEIKFHLNSHRVLNKLVRVYTCGRLFNTRHTMYIHNKLLRLIKSQLAQGVYLRHAKCGAA